VARRHAARLVERRAIAQGLLSLRALSGRHGVSFDASVGAAPFIDRYKPPSTSASTPPVRSSTLRQVWQFALRAGVGSLSPQ